jgi:hypothetical protein
VLLLPTVLLLLALLILLLLLLLLPLLLLQMSDIGLLIFDEAHHCKSDHPYNQIMQVSSTQAQTLSSCLEPELVVHQAQR